MFTALVIFAELAAMYVLPTVIFIAVHQWWYASERKAHKAWQADCKAERKAHGMDY